MVYSPLRIAGIQLVTYTWLNYCNKYYWKIIDRCAYIGHTIGYDFYGVQISGDMSLALQFGLIFTKC
jgi:hypothetical protein